MSASGQSRIILIADDDADDRLLLRDAFQEIGATHRLEFVGDGEELLEHLQRCGRFANRAPSPMPALVLLDLNMPRVDGREALARIKGDPALVGIPVVIVTTSAAGQDIDNSYALGANAYITKPATYSALVEIVRVLDRYWFETVELPGRDQARRSGGG